MIVNVPRKKPQLKSCIVYSDYALENNNNLFEPLIRIHNTRQNFYGASVVSYNPHTNYATVTLNNSTSQPTASDVWFAYNETE